MAAVQNLCGRAFLLHNGQLQESGSVQEVVQSYLSEGVDRVAAEIDLGGFKDRKRVGRKLLQKLRVLDSNLQPRFQFANGEKVALEILVHSDEPIRSPKLGIGVNNSLGQRVFTVSTRFNAVELPDLQDRMKIICILPPLSLAAGLYYLKLAFGSANADLDTLDDIPAFEIIANDVFGSGKLPRSAQGVIYVSPEWAFETEKSR